MTTQSLLFESRQARVFKSFIKLLYIDQATCPQSLTAKILKFSHLEAYLILNFKIPFPIFKILI